MVGGCMKSFKQHLITEAKYPPRVKGWGNAKTGKLALTLIKGKYKPYHQEFAARNLNKLGLKEKDAIKYLNDAYTPPTANHTKRLWKNIQDGVIDRDKAFEDFLNKNGWYSIVIDEGTYSIGDYKGGLRKYHKIAVAIDKKFGADSMFQDSSDFFEVGTQDIDNKYDWNNYIKTKKVGSRTDIGRTMAQFREQDEIYPKSYLRNKKLMDLVKKHSDPFKFLLAVIDHMNRGKLNLKRIGASSTREVAALWNDFNNKKIPAGMLESIVYRDGKFVVTNKDKSKVLGTHDTKKKALAQLAAVEISKQQQQNEVYKDSGLGKWFGKGGKGGVGKGGWDRYNTKGERIGKCGDAKPGEGKPKCLSKAKADKLRRQGGKKAIANAVKRKKAKDPQTDRPGTGNKPINVSNRIDKDPKKKGIQDSHMKSFKNYIEEKNKPTNPGAWSDCISQAKSKFDVYPSAYANAWASKCYKKKGGGWKKETKEDCGCVDEKSGAWTRKAGQNKEGGLNAAGRRSYERENPGSDLKAPVSAKQAKKNPKGKAAKRRKSFCARMGGMKGPMKDPKTGKPTRKALALRKWDC